MDGVAKAAVHVVDSKLTTLFREVGLAMMLKKISSRSVGHVTGGSIPDKFPQSNKAKMIGSRADLGGRISFHRSVRPQRPSLLLRSA